MRALSVEEQTITELSDHLMLDPSTLVPAVDALERKGFAKRGKDPSDRRRIPISLTDSGTDLIQTIRILDEQDPLVQSLNALTAEQRQQLLVLLRELVQSLPEGEDLLEKAAARVHFRGAGGPA
jgi:DNA-binding MarR family transcriptional regulator